MVNSVGFEPLPDYFLLKKCLDLSLTPLFVGHMINIKSWAASGWGGRGASKQHANSAFKTVFWGCIAALYPKDALFSFELLFFCLLSWCSFLMSLRKKNWRQVNIFWSGLYSVFPGKEDQKAKCVSRLWADGGLLRQELALLNITNEKQHTHTHTLLLAADQLCCESSIMLSVTQCFSACNNITLRFPRWSPLSRLLCLHLSGKLQRWNIHPHTLWGWMSCLGTQESQPGSH